MAKVDIKSGSTILADGLLQLQDGLAMDGTLRNVADQSNTISPLKLSTSLVSVDSSLGVKTSSPVSNLETRTSDGLGSVKIYDNDNSSSPLHLLRGNNGGVAINTFSSGGTIDLPTDRTILGYLSRFTGNVYVDGSFRTAARIEYYLTSVPSAANLNCAIRFMTASPSTYSIEERAGITSDGNFQIGDSIVNNRNSKLFIKGSGSTSATTSLTVQNSSADNLFRVRDDNAFLIGDNTSRPLFGPVIGTSSFSASGTALQFAVDNIFRTSVGFDFLFTYGTRNYTSGNCDVHRELSSFSPTSGTGVFNQFVITGTINQTGGANGITRCLFINPTLTAAADFRAIEVSSGGAYINTTSVNASAILQADSTTQGFLPPRMTDAQIRAIASPAEGLVAYNTDISHLCCYQGGAWVKFNHSPM